MFFYFVCLLMFVFDCTLLFNCTLKVLLSQIFMNYQGLPFLLICFVLLFRETTGSLGLILFMLCFEYITVSFLVITWTDTHTCTHAYIQAHMHTQAYMQCITAYWWCHCMIMTKTPAHYVHIYPRWVLLLFLAILMVL